MYFGTFRHLARLLATTCIFARVRKKGAGQQLSCYPAPERFCEKWCPQFTQNREHRHTSPFIRDMYFPTLALSKSGSRSRLTSLLSAHLFELPISEHYTRLTLNLQASKSSKYIISIQRESTGIRTLRNCQPAVFIKITVRIHLA